MKQAERDDMHEWLEQERKGTWRGIDVLHINAILKAYQEFVTRDGDLMDISMEVFMARWLSISDEADRKEAELWAKRRK
jgi:hypothetical protein